MELNENLKYDQLSLNQFLELFPAGIILIDADYNIQYVNSNFFHFKLCSFETVEELSGRNILEKKIFSSTEVNSNIESLNSLIGFETEIRSEKTLVGGEISIMVKGVPVIGKDGYSGGLIIVEDIMFSSNTLNERIVNSTFFSSIIENSLDYFFISDISGIISYSLRGRKSQTSDAIAKFKSNNLNDLLADIPANLLENILENAIVSNRPVSKILSCSIGGFKTIIEFSAIPVRSQGEQTASLIVLVKEIVQKAPEPESLSKKSEIEELQRYREIAGSVLDAVVELTLQGKVAFWNDAAAKLFGISKSEIFGKFVGKVIPSIDENYFKILVNDLKKNKSWNSDIKIFSEEGVESVVAIRLGLINSGSEESVVMLCTDITERANSEKELRYSEERFRNIVTNTREYICTLELDGKIAYVNPAFKNAFGFTDEEIKSKYFTDLIDNSGLDDSFKLDEIAKQKIEGLELNLLTKSGDKISALSSITSVEDFNHNIIYYNVVLTDITLKKQAEIDLMLTRSVFEASQDGIAVLTERKFLLVNDFFAKMFGYKSVDEIIGKDPLDFVCDEDIPHVAQYIQEREKLKESPGRYEFTGLRKDGSKFSVENSVASYQVNEKVFIVFLLRDITESKLAQQALEASEERYRSIAETIEEFIWTAELRNNKLEAVLYTPAVEKITGYSSKDFLGNSYKWARIIHPDDFSEILKKMKGLYLDTARSSDEFEYRIINKAGNIVWIKNNISLVRGKNEQISNIVGLVSDITYEKKAEVELQKSAANLKDLNDTKDRFISIISHDLRTPFSSILGFTDLLLNDRDMPETKQIEYIQFIQESSKSMLALVNSLLDWTRLQTGRFQFQPTKMNSVLVVNKSIQMLSGAAIQKNIELLANFEKDIYIHGDESLLLQVFNNLVSNAIKFTPHGGAIEIGAKPVVEKKHVEFYVKDSGQGIREEDLPKLFNIDAKHTTPGTAGEKGSGLGLSLCYEIVKKHGGEIWVESEPGNGSIFKFTIPVSSSSILLIDDGKTDRILYAKLLNSLFPEYNVIFAVNGKEGLSLVKMEQPALVISDHKMPVMSGYEFVKQLKITELNYNPPVIILSSDINETITDEYRSLGIEFVFKKPVNITAFKNAIESCLKKALFN